MMKLIVSLYKKIFHNPTDILEKFNYEIELNNFHIIRYF